MLIKLIGAAIILISSVSLGILLSMQEGYRIKDLEETAAVLKRLISLLKYNRDILSTALINASANANDNIRAIFNSIASAVNNGTSSKTAWRMAIEQGYKKTFLNKEDSVNLKSLAQILDSPDIDLLQSGFDRAVDCINEAIDRAREKEQRDKKLYRSICTSIGIFLIIILF